MQVYSSAILAEVYIDDYVHSVPKSAEDVEFWSQYTISVKYLAKLDVSAEVVITDIVSFLHKILGRNQDFPKGSVCVGGHFLKLLGERV